MSQTATIYLIRHGEKPPSGNTLSDKGVERSQALRQVFGPGSPYNIGHIMAEHPKHSGSDQRPFDTVTPLAADLGLKIDISCKRDDTSGVADAAKNYSGTGDILICWEHHHLYDIATALGVPDAPQYPDDRFDIIWTIPPPYNQIVTMTSENTPADKGLPAPKLSSRL